MADTTDVTMKENRTTVTETTDATGDAAVNVSTGAVFDQQRAEAAVRELLIAVGEDPDREDLR